MIGFVGISINRSPNNPPNMIILVRKSMVGFVSKWGTEPHKLIIVSEHTYFLGVNHVEPYQIYRTAITKANDGPSPFDGDFIVSHQNSIGHSSTRSAYSK